MANMAAHEEWFQQKIFKLANNENNRTPVLKEVKEFLTTIPREEMVRTASNLQLPALFDCLNDSNSEQVDLACEVLTLCMMNLNLGESTNKYGVFLERALNHPFSAVKLMALNEIRRNIENEDILVDLCKKEVLISKIIKCMGDSELEVAMKAFDVLKIIGLSDAGIRQLFNDNMLKKLHEVMEINEIVRFRVYDLIIHISIPSETNFDLIKPTGLLSQILSELDNNDILLRLNVMALLSSLCLTKHGYDYIESNDVLKKLVNMLNGDDLMMIQLCEPGILKFFGNVVYWKPLETLSKYQFLCQRLFTNINSDNFTVLSVSLDTLGHIANSNDGKIALESTNLMDDMIKRIIKSLPSMPSEIKVRSLNCIKHLLELVEPNNQLMQITQKWYAVIDHNPMNFIWGYLNNPFTELRIGGFNILHAISGQLWGQEAIKNYPGLIEFLLNRNLEREKGCKEIKYKIIEVLAKSNVFDAARIEQLQNFVKEGPFYVQSITEIALEGDD